MSLYEPNRTEEAARLLGLPVTLRSLSLGAVDEDAWVFALVADEVADSPLFRFFSFFSVGGELFLRGLIRDWFVFFLLLDAIVLGELEASFFDASFKAETGAICAVPAARTAEEELFLAVALVGGMVWNTR